MAPSSTCCTPCWRRRAIMWSRPTIAMKGCSTTRPRGRLSPRRDIVYLVASSVSARPQERREGGGCMARIVVVDDEGAIRELLRAVLEHEGYGGSEARTGAEGLLRYQGAPTDLVMIDMQMSGMDGLVLMLALQRAFPRVKVIAISGDRRRLEVARTFTPHTVEKPFALDEVRTTV